MEDTEQADSQSVSDPAAGVVFEVAEAGGGWRGHACALTELAIPWLHLRFFWTTGYAVHC